MKKIFIFLLILILIPLGILIYLGFVPGISKYVVKPVDLGVKEDSSFISPYEKKINFKNELPGGIVPAGREGIFSGSTKIDEKISSIQATSILAEWKRRSATLPIRDVQVRFNQDGTAEISGILEIATAISIAKNLGYSDTDIEKGRSYAKYVSGDLPFYVKGIAGVTDNQISINPSYFQLGKVAVPSSISEPAARVVEDVIERRLNQVGGIDIKSAKIDAGAINFSGTIPSSIK